ncbi:MAG: hypothetical protein D6744_08265 [Planctomycetota bacterium]|nr:MAG: hypothetical protein D6744_08265 [Planctomycetota bacterium]
MDGSANGRLHLPGHAFVVNDILDVSWSGDRRCGMKITAVVADDEAADAVFDPENPRRAARDCSQCLIEPQAVGRGDRRGGRPVRR